MAHVAVRAGSLDRRAVHVRARSAIRIESRERAGSARRVDDLTGRLAARCRMGREHRRTGDGGPRAPLGGYFDPLFGNLYSFNDRTGRHPTVLYDITPSGDWVEVDPGSTASFRDATMLPGVKQTRVDQFSAGIEHQSARDVALEVRYVHRAFRDFVGYVDPLLAEATAVSVLDPGPDGALHTADDAGPMSVYRPSPGEHPLGLGNIPGAWRDYDAVQLVATKRLANRWQGQASYTWSRSTGTLPNLCELQHRILGERARAASAPTRTSIPPGPATSSRSSTSANSSCWRLRGSLAGRIHGVWHLSLAERAALGAPVQPCAVRTGESRAARVTPDTILRHGRHPCRETGRARRQPPRRRLPGRVQRDERRQADRVPHAVFTVLRPAGHLDGSP